MVNKSTSEAILLNKRSSLAAALGVAKVITYKYGHTLLCCFCLIKMGQQTHLRVCFFNKSSSLGAALGVTKVITVMATNLVTLCCVAEVQLRCSTNPPSKWSFLNESLSLVAA